MQKHKAKIVAKVVLIGKKKNQKHHTHNIISGLAENTALVCGMVEICGCCDLLLFRGFLEVK